MQCTIRKWNLQDAPALAALLNNKKILDNLRDGLPYPYTIKDAEEYITAMLSADPNETFAFAITVKNDADAPRKNALDTDAPESNASGKDTVVGSIGIFRGQNIHRRTAEVGYYIGESYWGSGIGTSALTQACKHVFETSDILRIYAEPFAYNIASCRILEKAGFQFEGVLRSNAVKNGQVIDMKMYSLIREQGV